ncbi:type II secretion system secretin GspD [Salinispirillum sp. LH 10-3-1]|uniref:Type II secretion system secretin GspD n=1 Tax=Salinispirillum sp. LH 10-3-1 TaxID=2952525 RepID=A0AB38YJ29_9GAMM
MNSMRAWVKQAVFVLVLSMVAWQAKADTWQVNMKEADLSLFINQVASITGRTFILDPRVRGQVTIISDDELNAEEIYEVFLAVLKMQGFTVAERGNEVHVIPVNDAKQITGPLVQGEVPINDDFITRVITLQHASAMELIPILRPIGAKYGHMSGVPSTNAIILVDHADNIARIEQILNTIDVTADSDIRMVELRHAWVGNIIALLQTLLPDELAAGGQASSNGMPGTLRLVADERSNRLILRGEPRVLDYVEGLILSLDVESQQRRGNTEVIFLNNGDAGKMAELLKGLNPGGASVVRTGTTSGGSSGGSAPSAPPNSGLFILADEELNALIVRAEPDELAEIKRIIAQLDIPRAQVLIEAAIVEVSGTVSDQFGVQMGLVSQGNNGLPPGLIGSNFPGSGVSLGDVGVAGSTGDLGQAALPLAGTEGVAGGLAIPGSNMSFAAIVQALETRSNTNLLSTPYLMTMDNTEARILVGETVPFQTSRDPDNPFTIQRENVATEITVKPHIQQNEMVRLAINQVTEELIAGGADLQRLTSKRQIQTNVVVANGDTIVLGGMVKDRVTETERKVPLLGDLPIIGFLFRSTQQSNEKVNLLVIIRPTIVTERVTEMAMDRYLGIWELRFGPTGTEFDSRVAPPTFDQLYRGQQTQ